MFCETCGNKLDDRAKFCSACGNQVVSNNNQSSPRPIVGGNKLHTALSAWRWIAFFPVGLILGWLLSSFWIGVGGYFLGKWAITSAIVLLIAGGSTPVGAASFGLKIAPTQSHTVKWVIVTPMIVVSLFLLWILFSAEASSWGGFEPFTGLSARAQGLWISSGVILGTIYAAVTSPEEIAKD